MTLYLDTSVLVAALTREAHSLRVTAWINDQEDNEFAISDWVVTEFSAALSMKLRAKQINFSQRTAALMQFSRFCIDNAVVLEILRGHFRTAAALSDRSGHGVRAADALHLAACMEHGATLCTLDRRLSESGPPLGVATLLV